MWTLFISFTLPLFVERRVHFDVGVLLFEPIKEGCSNVHLLPTKKKIVFEKILNLTQLKWTVKAC